MIDPYKIDTPSWYLYEDTSVFLVHFIQSAEPEFRGYRIESWRVGLWERTTSIWFSCEISVEKLTPLSKQKVEMLLTTYDLIRL